MTTLIERDTMSIDQILGKIMEDYRTESLSSSTIPPLRGKALVDTIVDRLVSNQIDLNRVSLWDMKRMVRDAGLAYDARGEKAHHCSCTAT